MAIKVTGTTVINDSRGLENVTNINNVIEKPSITSPTANETEVEFSGLTIAGTAYSALFDGTRDYREVQVDLSSGDFSSPVLTQQENSDSVTLTTDLAGETEFKVRIRDVDTDGIASEFSDAVTFTTKSTLELTTLGQSCCGGFYMGTICAASTCYYLIVAPNSSGCACCGWKTSQTFTSGTGDRCDGYANTYPALANSTHPAGNWTATRTIDGFSDWYMPAIEELRVFYDNGGGNGAGDPLPSGEDFGTSDFWSSTENGTLNACSFYFYNGTQFDNGNKALSSRVRAVRREPI